jgi:hypothetical protein
MHAPQARWIVLISGDTDRDHPFAGDHVKGERMACVGGPRREQEPVRPTIAFTCKMNRIQLGEHRCSSSEAVSVGTGEKVLFRHDRKSASARASIVSGVANICTRLVWSSYWRLSICVVRT